jgi:hypothetical protein
LTFLDATGGGGDLPTAELPLILLLLLPLSFRLLPQQSSEDPVEAEVGAEVVGGAA